MMSRYWLMKSEPDVYGIEDLARDGKGEWDGVRNYQARNFMRDQMKLGDRVLFYHSNAKPPGVAGLAEVCREGYPDFTAWDPKSKYHDPKSPKESPRWFMVDVKYVETFPEVVPLEALRTTPGLEEMLVIRKGQRLSIQPVTKDEYQIVTKMGRGGQLRRRGGKKSVAL